MAEKPRIARRVTWAAAIALLLAGVVGAVAWFAGRTVWTDGQSVRVGAPDARLREVLWAAAKPLESVLNAAEQQYEPSLSPDGTELYFVRGKPGSCAHIYVSYRRENAWTAPVRLEGVNGPTDDLGPRVTHDGRYLVFSSDRPGGRGGYDLWASRREQGGWRVPFNLGSGVNTEFNELNPDPTPDGRRLIFSTNRKAASLEQAQAWRGTIRETGSADYDLWVATRAPDGPPVPASATQPATRPAGSELIFGNAAEIAGVNTSSSEGASCVSPAGDFLYFASDRPGGLGKFDIYRSRIRDGGAFGAPENVGPPINTPDNEADPSLAMAGFRMYFSSDRGSPAGTYTLHTSDSREVFRLREGRPFPRLGWSVWSLLVSALLLIPLLLALRGIEGRHLSIIQRCLLLSLLLHAAITFVLSFVMVSRDVTRSIGRGTGGEIAVNLSLPKDVEIGLAVRGQLSAASELPPVTVNEPAPAARVQQATPTGEPIPDPMTAPASSAKTALPQSSLTLAAKPHTPDVPASDRPTVVVATVAAAPLPDIAPRELTKPAPQVGPETPAVVERQPRLASRAQVADVAETRPPEVLTSPIPSSPASTASAAAIDPPAIDASKPALAGDALAVTVQPRVPRSDGSLEVPEPKPSAIGAGNQRIAPEAAPAFAPQDAPPAVTRLTAAVRATGDQPSAVAPTAPPVRPATNPVDAVVAVVPTRAAPIGATGRAADVRPAAMAVAGSAAIFTPPPLPVTANPTSVVRPAAGADVPNSADVLPSLTRLSSGERRPTDSPQLAQAPRGSPTTAPVDSLAPSSAVVAPALRPPELMPADPVTALAARPPDVIDVPVPPVALPVAAKVSEPSARATAPESARPADARMASQRSTPDAPVPSPRPLPSLATPSPIAADRMARLDIDPVAGRAIGPLPVESPATPVSPATTVASAALPNLPPPPGVAATTPRSPFPRSPEERQPRIEKLGGNRQSESAVDRGLAYLASQQEPDGRWTLILDDARPPGRRPKSYHDMANTGLAALAFLARDNAPGKAGPYPEAVARALDYLIDQQDDDGDLRGPAHLRGEGSRRGDMYDHAIATLALAEAALMTGGDKRYADAALRGAHFIVVAQDDRSGGWRYVPGEYGDSSVFGWQVMALHAAEQLGFEIPDRTRLLARYYIRLASQGPRKMLAGYQPGKAPTPTMTAELLYGRMLLGQKLDPDDIGEATAFLAGQPPDPREPSLYYWYYASLCMLQVQSPDWKAWNARTRDTLIALQTRGGAHAGSWNADPRYAERGGRVYMTAIAVLTLEVYYRYLPLPDRGALGVN